LQDQVESSRIVFDLTDLLIYYSKYLTVSGIQRVTERLTATAYLQGDPNTYFVAHARETSSFVQLDKSLFADLVKPEKRPAAISTLNIIRGYLDDYRLHQRLKKYPWKLLEKRYRRLKQRVDKAGNLYSLANVTRFEFKPGDWLVLPGAYWINNVGELYVRLRHDHGLRLCVFVYDLIPVTHPWCVGSEGTETFQREFGRIMGCCDQFVAISRHVAEEVSRYLNAYGVERRPILILPFGWDFPDHSSDHKSEAETLARYGLKRREFILVVGTLERRKNHSLIARAAYNLYPELKDKIPHIVFLGNRGFGVGFLEGELASMGYLDGRIRVLSHVNDRDLENLYAACRFTIFPSFVEGWGLPVQESLAFGRPCLASSTTSIPEAGLHLATYFDPHDLPGFQSLFTRWIDNNAHVEAAEMRIAKHLTTYALPRWEDSAAAVVNFLRTRGVAPLDQLNESAIRQMSRS
jgi:glycosyltransferase involved in cell wall biosynthesis